MKLCVVFLVAAVFTITCVEDSNASTIALGAIDTASPRTNAGGDDQNADNRLRVYNVAGIHIDGFMKFDLSVLPDLATITAMTLTLYAEGVFGPQGTPQIQIRRSSFDGWARGGSGFPTSYNEILTAVDSGPFPSTQHQPYSWALNVAAVNWTSDLNDNLLTLVLADPNTSASNLMYWYGSSGVSATGDSNSSGNVFAYIPTLTVDFDSAVNAVPEPATLLLAGFGVATLAARQRRQRQQEEPNRP